jgi:hypothetical protein
MNLRRLAQIIPFVLLTGLAVSSAQDPPHPLCSCKPRPIGASGSRVDWDGYTKSVRWHYSIDEALKIARAEGKLVFWQQIVGDMDKEGC